MLDHDTCKRLISDPSSFAAELIRVLGDSELCKVTDASRFTTTALGFIRAIDQLLSEQVSLLLHHEQFTQLEGAWRGLWYLVSNTEPADTLKIRVLNVSRSDLSRLFSRYKGLTWSESAHSKGTFWQSNPLFRAIAHDEFDCPGGYPFGAVIGDFYFDHQPDSIQILIGIAQVCAAAHAPFIAGASPSVIGLNDWREINEPRELAPRFQGPEFAPWRSLRESDDARYVALTLPRVLARAPCVADAIQARQFEFVEAANGADLNTFCWMNAAYAMAVNIGRAWRDYGWLSRISGVENGGLVEGLPLYDFPTHHPGVKARHSLEVRITSRRENELAKAGFIALLHHEATACAVNDGACSLYKACDYDDPDACLASRVFSSLRYTFIDSLFARYVKCIARDKMGRFKTVDDLERYLNQWISQYESHTPQPDSEEASARRPLSAAQIYIRKESEAVHTLVCQVCLRPRHQFDVSGARQVFVNIPFSRSTC